MSADTTTPVDLTAAREALARLDLPPCLARVPDEHPNDSCERPAGHDGPCRVTPDPIDKEHLRAALAEVDRLTAQTAAIRALLEQHLGGWTEATTPHPEQPEMGPMPTLVEGVAALVADRDFAFARVEELERAASEALAARGAK